MNNFNLSYQYKIQPWALHAYYPTKVQEQMSTERYNASAMDQLHLKNDSINMDEGDYTLRD